MVRIMFEVYWYCRERQAGCTQTLLDECDASVKKGLYVKRDKEGKEVTGVWDIHLRAEDVVRDLFALVEHGLR